MKEGSSVAGPLEASGVFEPIVVRMVAVGEESGKVSEMIEKVALYYQDRVDTLIARVGILIEPVILVVLGLIIGVVVIALMFPIITISSAIH